MSATRDDDWGDDEEVTYWKRPRVPEVSRIRYPATDSKLRPVVSIELRTNVPARIYPLGNDETAEAELRVLMARASVMVNADPLREGVRP